MFRVCVDMFPGSGPGPEVRSPLRMSSRVPTFATRRLPAIRASFAPCCHPNSATRIIGGWYARFQTSPHLKTIRTTELPGR